MWHSNSPLAPTGYGQQTALFAPRLKEQHRIAISVFWGLEAAPIKWEGIPLLPSLGGDWGNDYLAGHVRAMYGDLRDALVLTLMDVFVLDPEIMATMHLAAWTPVDHDPLPKAHRHFFEVSGAIPLAMSRFGYERLEEFDPIYVPHAIDRSVFRPRDKAAVREKIGADPDGFIVGMVAANKGPSRKGFAQALEAFAELQSRHENAYLYLHTDVAGQIMQGLPLQELIKALEIPRERIMISDQYRLFFSPFSDDEMAKLYSSFDVLLNPAMGEGFGIPIAEAQACGTPVIATDFSAMSEVAGPGCWKVDGRRAWTGQRAWQMLPDVDEISEALESCYALTEAERDENAELCTRHVEQYDLDLVLYEHMLPALAEIEERIGARPDVEALAA